MKFAPKTAFAKEMAGARAAEDAGDMRLPNTIWNALIFWDSAGTELT